MMMNIGGGYDPNDDFGADNGGNGDYFGHDYGFDGDASGLMGGLDGFNFDLPIIQGSDGTGMDLPAPSFHLMTPSGPNGPGGLSGGIGIYYSM
jgi:hypothetical protein